MGQLPDFKKLRVETSTSSKILRLVLLLLFALGLMASVVYFMKWMAFEKPTRSELWQKVAAGRDYERKAALTQWLLELQTSPESIWRPLENEQRILTAQMNSLLMETQARHEELALIIALLGFSPSDTSENLNSIVDLFWLVLEKARREASSAWERVEIETLIALSRLGEPHSQETFDKFFQKGGSAQVSVRKAYAYAAGVALEKVHRAGSTSQSENWVQSLKQSLYELLEDSDREVLWNATFALARSSDPKALPLLKRILIEAKETKAHDPTFGKLRHDLYVQAFSLVKKYQDMELRSILSEISREHPHLKLRQAAKIFVEKTSTIER